MKTVRFHSLVFLVITFSLSGVSQVLADLNAYEIVSQVNALNDGKGIAYQTTTTYGAMRAFSADPSYDFADTSAYSRTAGTGGNNFFKSFCVAYSVNPIIDTLSYGTLNYQNGKSTTSRGCSLNLGAAFLYKQFATGALGGVYNYATDSNSFDLRYAVQYLIGDTNYTSWESNTFLQYLLTVNADKSFWYGSYDPGQYYNLIGDYSVFVLRVSDGTTSKSWQDHLYLAQATSSSTPEPATLALWGLGSLGIAGSRYYRRRKSFTTRSPKTRN